MDLVTIEQVRAHCRTEPEDDVLVTLYADSAEQQVQDFLNRRVFKNQAALDAAVETGEAGESPMVVNAVIIDAILLATAGKFRDREPTQHLPVSLTTLLWPHRVGLGV